MDIKRNSWEPDGDIISHCGLPIRSDADFFVSPPAEIGRVLTADSALGRYDNPLSNAMFKKRGWMIVGLMLLCVVAIVGIMFAIQAWASGALRSGDLLFSLMLVAGFVATGIPIYVSRRASERKMKVLACSFVGENGAAVYTLKGGIGDEIAEDVLMFADAADLLVSREGSSPSIINYKYNWRDAEGESLLLYEGRRYSMSKTFSLRNPFYFLRAAEEQWCDYRYEMMKAEFEKEGYVEFAIGSQRTIRVGMEYIELLWPDGDYRVPIEDFTDISLSGEMFRFKHRDGAWMGREGKFNFQYADLSNAKLFITALDHLAGISWPDED